jgi:hypothetical protein
MSRITPERRSEGEGFNCASQDTASGGRPY